jgi:hypothetical protein
MIVMMNRRLRRRVGARQCPCRRMRLYEKSYFTRADLLTQNCRSCVIRSRTSAKSLVDEAQLLNAVLLQVFAEPGCVRCFMSLLHMWLFWFR